HEDSLMRFLDDVSVGPAWLYYGGVATLASYGVEARHLVGCDARHLFGIQDEFRRRLPSRHLTFLQRLPLSYDEGDYVFVHAGIRPGLSLEAQIREDLLWIRDDFLASPVDHGKVVVHGHTIAPEPELLPNRIGIDTGAFASGRLTCVVLAGASRSILST
ncbi:MAG: metallophosphoesterase family protein, partial [Dongiaceae bacterium]